MVMSSILGMDVLSSCALVGGVTGVLGLIGWLFSRKRSEPPVSPTNVKMDAVSDEAVQLSWNSSQPCSGICPYHFVVERRREDELWVEVGRRKGGTGWFKFSSECLTGDTVYCFRVYAVKAYMSTEPKEIKVKTCLNVYQKGYTISTPSQRHEKKMRTS